jgi:DNA topoisomerase-1
VVVDETAARGLVTALDGSTFTVSSVDERPYRSAPKAPFITSTLQQEGGRKLGLTSRQVMQAAQALYEGGYITYMRTDSVTLSTEALAAARSQVRELYGDRFLPETPRGYRSTVKNAQEAHEAIRPAGDRWRTPDQLQGELRSADQRRLYDLIWKRTLASQMADALGKTVSVRIEAPLAEARADGPTTTDWAASGRTITFPGYLRVYVEGSDDPEADLDDRERLLPDLVVGQVLPDPAVDPVGHTTQPPARFTEASLVKRLEELGIGRPSTWASIMQTIQERGYVWKKGQALVPSWSAFAVVQLLEGHFSAEVDYTFTARMENQLDEIATGSRERVPFLHSFWFGNGSEGLTTLIDHAMANADPAVVNAVPLGKDQNGEVVMVRNGRFGPYLKRGEDTVSLPEDMPPDELSVARALELLAAPKGDEPLGTDPASGLPVFVKSGRFGPYVQLGDAETLPEGAKPKTASVFKTMDAATLPLDVAMQLLTLPRTVGVDPTTGEEIIARQGPYGPFLKRGDDSRNLAREEDLLTVSLEEALRVFAEPKRRGRAAAAPLRELGPDPVSGKPIVVKDGRYGPYATDGETNASLREREGDTVEGLTLERAAELLQARRDAGPSTRGRKRASAKKTAAKTSTAKKAGAAKKASAKKTAAKKTAAKKAPAKKAAAKKSAS